jgi:hypothetical protein
MRPARSIWIALALALLAAAPVADAAARKVRRAQPLASQPAPAPMVCVGGCLIDRVLQAMMDHDPSRAPLAPDVRYTENGQATAPGQGFWASASAIAISDDGLTTLGINSSAYRLYFADPATGQAAYVGAFTENGSPGLMMLRLKSAQGQITEIEAAMVRKADPAAPPAPGFDARGFTEPEPTLLAGGERWAPNIMTAAANRYFDAMETRSSAGVPIGADCIRRDNGVQTTTQAVGCAAQLDTGWFTQVLQVRRRVAVVDEERGLVMAIAMVDHGARPEPPKKKLKPKKGAPPEPLPVTSTDLMGVVFKMSEGKITRIEAIDRPVAKGQDLGWGP